VLRAGREPLPASFVRRSRRPSVWFHPVGSGPGLPVAPRGWRFPMRACCVRTADV